MSNTSVGSSSTRGRPEALRPFATAAAWLAYLAVVAHGYVAALRELMWPHSLSGNTKYDMSDLDIYLGALRAFGRSGTFYDYVAANGAPFTYPPFAGLLMDPLRFADVTVVKVLWPIAVLLAAAVFAWRLAPRLARFTASWWPEDAWRTTPVLPLTLAFVTGSQIVTSNLLMGQVSIFVMLLAMLDAARIVPYRFRGIAVGLAGAIKLTPLIFVPYLWLTGQRRAAVIATGTFAACTGAAWAILPGDSLRYWTSELWHTDRVADAAAAANMSVKGMLAHLGVSGGAGTAVWAVLAAVITVAGLWRAYRADRGGDALLGAVIAGAVSLCVSPVSWDHHAIWLVLAAGAVVGARGGRADLAWLASVVVVTCVLTSNTVAGHLPDGARTLMTGMLTLLAIAIACLVPFTACRSRTQARLPRGRAGVNHDATPDELSALRPGRATAQGGKTPPG